MSVFSSQDPKEPKTLHTGKEGSLHWWQAARFGLQHVRFRRTSGEPRRFTLPQLVFMMSDSEPELQMYCKMSADSAQHLQSTSGEDSSVEQSTTCSGDDSSVEQSSGDHSSVEQPRSILRVPLPRQMTYDGTSNWQGFILPFMSLASSCGWTQKEKLFRLCSSLRGEAAEYAFVQLESTPEVVNSFELFVLSLHTRFFIKTATFQFAE